jgi:hypothetical protein
MTLVRIGSNYSQVTPESAKLDPTFPRETYQVHQNYLMAADLPWQFFNCLRSDPFVTVSTLYRTI